LSNMQISPIISTKCFEKISDTLLASSIVKQLVTQLPNSTILFPSFNTNPTSTTIIPHSQHVHTCVLCNIKNLPYILS
ncbi:9211_t:CDS:1, partial [Cetraspora pellucida]